MILPDKNITLSNSLLGGGAYILSILRDGDTLLSLWKKARENESMKNYEKFILTLDFLYLIECIEYQNGIFREIKKC